ncbi:MAG: RluA family pseudouridine synthase [Flavobacteriales bacterium]|jgi:23S rRNA pseudouridine1911/1915/1917 synthase|nr:RluA family pseudouridine synthase [Flavobacteriales bacterium]MDP7430381.1 RluA family pseudouridine synthase [Flavobacteriales bacterium]HJN64352.1 RluA family pseudouridine synthase [Flavobacteriales bacterium]|tara:strand:+ start:7950 stop:8963 length:1014 start_codon:yes stop_codon:yes gene_type:complete
MEEKDKLFEHYKFIADKGQSPLRVDKFLINFIEHATRTKIQKAASEGNIKVNGNVVKSNYKVKAGDVVTVEYSSPKKKFELIPEDVPLNIVYEDDDFLIVNKDAGMVVHPGFGNYSGTLVNALAFHFKNLPNMGDEDRPGLVHRIDKNTSGILVIAKTEKSITILAKKFADRELNRKYIALVWGDVKEDRGTITGHIGRSLKNRKVMTVFTEGDFGKHAVTHYKVLERFGYTTLVECKLETGRTHQIRVHFKQLGHPLFNDEEYGGNQILKGTTFTKYKQFVLNCFKICQRQALHAKSLGFAHPATGKEVNFDSELAEDMQLLIEKWRGYAKHQKED